MQATKLKQQNYILENNKNEDMREYGSQWGEEKHQNFVGESRTLTCSW